LALRLFYMQNAKEDVRSDISIMRRAAEKAETEVSKAEIDKQNQVCNVRNRYPMYYHCPL